MTRLRLFLLLVLPLGWAWPPPARVPRRSPQPSMTIALVDQFPEQGMQPTRVVELQLMALQQGNSQVYWRFLSPECKTATGILRPRYLKPYYAKPDYAKQLPQLWRARRFEIVGSLPISDALHQCRTRVWPQQDQVVECIWRLALQPLVRPACYEFWDPLQAGISAGPPFEGCWLVDDVRLDDRWGGHGAAIPPAPPRNGWTAELTPSRTTQSTHRDVLAATVR